MREASEIKVNYLPVKTWYWLNMNDSKIKVQIEDKIDSPFQKHIKGNGVSFQIKDKISQWNAIETGMGPDMKFFDSKGIACIETEDTPNQTEQSIVLEYKAFAEKINTNHIFVHAQKGTKVAITMVLSSEEGEGIQALQTKIMAEENSQVKIFVVQMLGKKFKGLFDLGGICETNAQVELVKIELGAGELYAGALVDLVGENSRFDTQIGYLGREKQILDMNYVARHVGKKTESNMQVSGVLREQAAKLFRGTIDFKNGCAGAKGNEKEDVLLLGDDAINRTIPLILCQEEEVEGNHGATIGRLSEETLFYMGSRGIEKETAENLIARAKLDTIAVLIPEKDIQEKIRGWFANEGL